MYRANSVLSHTAAPLRIKRPGETPMSALAAPPAAGTLLGASPTTSRVEVRRERRVLWALVLWAERWGILRARAPRFFACLPASRALPYVP